MEMPVDIYEQSAVVFIDILGFKNALRNESKARDILDALSHVKEKVEEYYSDPMREQFQGVFDIELTAFSDSIAISGSEGQAIVVVFAALEFSQLLMKKGFLCRGAMACGELYHNNGILFGNSLAEAYESEKSQAIYPRIILDTQTVQLIDESKNDPSDLAGLVKSDKDGRKFLNLLFEMHDSSSNLSQVLSNLVRNELAENCNSLGAQQKLMWLINEYSLQDSMP